MAGYLAAPLVGAFVAVSISYSLRHDIHADSVALADSLRAARTRLQETDEELRTGKTAEQRSSEQIRPPTYVRRPHPTLGEEIKARWNEHLTRFVQSAAELEWHDVAGRAYSRIRGVTEDKIAPALSDAAEAAEDLKSGTLRPAVKPSGPDPRLLQPNTHYLGQGTSLR